MRDATAALKVENEKARKEQTEKTRLAREYRLKVYREMGASEEEIREAGTRHLRRTGGNGGEVDFGAEWGKGDEDMEMRDADAAAAADADMGVKEAEAEA